MIKSQEKTQRNKENKEKNRGQVYFLDIEDVVMI
jgi:hypothetical protein